MPCPRREDVKHGSQALYDKAIWINYQGEIECQKDTYRTKLHHPAPAAEVPPVREAHARNQVAAAVPADRQNAASAISFAKRKFVVSASTASTSSITRRPKSSRRSFRSAAKFFRAA